MKFEQALRAMRRGKTIKRKAWGGIKYWVSGGEVVRLPPSGSAPGRSGVAEFSMQGLFEYTDWVIVRKKKRPDKPAPKVYTEAELEPVGTAPVIGDRVILDFGKAGQYEKEVAGIESERMYVKEPKEDTLGWPRYCWECHAGFRPVRILKRPLRCVFKDPRVGDVVRLGRESNSPFKFLYVDGRYVFAESGDVVNVVNWWTRADWASLATSNHTVISRASK